MSDNGQPAAADDGGVGALLADPDRSVAYLATVRRAITERWPISPERRQRLLTVMSQIVEADTFEVSKIICEPGRNGEGAPSTDEKRESIVMPNHRNQVAAAKVLLSAAKLDQDDMHHLENLAAPRSGTSINLRTGPTFILKGEAWSKFVENQSRSSIEVRSSESLNPPQPPI